MADNGANDTQGNDAGAMPQINTLAQYVKDLSFENPNAPRSLQPQSSAPPINVQVNVNAKQMQSGEFEVELKLDGMAGESNALLFRFDLTYCGVFRLDNIPQDQLHPVVMIECPRLLFPFARQIVAEAVSNGGFPPFLLNPIDFVALYQQRAAEMQNQQGQMTN
ncbi:MAG: protein-export chaperone SecB [Beijerinckiaceae bacterium]